MAAIKKSTVRRRARKRGKKQNEVTAEQFLRMAADAEERARSLRELSRSQPKPDPAMESDARALDLFASIHKAEAAYVRGKR